MKNLLKKFAAAALILTLLLSCFGTANAEYMGKYKSAYLRQLNMNPTELTRDYPNCVFAAAMILLETMMAAPDGMEMCCAILENGGGYIAKYGTYHLDVYYPVGNGRYLNLYACPTDGEITDYSYGGDRRNADATYYWFSMDDMWGDVAVLLDRLY
ncbi:MAG: hypothetical protein IJ174_06830 [Clostridia bacterium]|nr:hypothetical protein [Clostridia bacterium]